MPAIAGNSGRRHLRSAVRLCVATYLYTATWTVRYGPCSFAVAGPSTCNSLLVILGSGHLQTFLPFHCELIENRMELNRFTPCPHPHAPTPKKITSGLFRKLAPLAEWERKCTFCSILRRYTGLSEESSRCWLCVYSPVILGHWRKHKEAWGLLICYRGCF